MKKILKSYRKVKKLPTWLFFPIALLIKTLKIFFMRSRVLDPHNCIDIKKLPYITVTWHNRLLFFPAMFSRKFRVRTYALISPSRDGQYVVDLISHFGVRSIRGSSFKRGATALKEAEEILNKGFSVSITPDGPRGPKYRMSQGPIILASKTGYPILPLSINASKYWELKSWDNFQIPKPGAKIELVVGNSIKIPPNLTENEIEQWQLFVENKLLKIS